MALGYLHAKTSGQPVYRYCFTRPRPEMRDKGLVAGLAGGVQKKDDSADKKSEVMTIPENDVFKGAVHSADIEYAMATLPTNRVYDWQPEDYRVSDQFINYYANFIKTAIPTVLAWPTGPLSQVRRSPHSSSLMSTLMRPTILPLSSATCGSCSLRVGAIKEWKTMVSICDDLLI